MSSYRQCNLKANISLEKDTEHVPHDGKYHLVVDGQLSASFRNLKQGQDAYGKLMKERNIATVVDVVPITDEMRKRLMREAVQKSYDGESAGSVKIQKRSGSRRFG